jgi:hypothetical protein
MPDDPVVLTPNDGVDAAATARALIKAAQAAPAPAPAPIPAHAAPAPAPVQTPPVEPAPPPVTAEGAPPAEGQTVTPEQVAEVVEETGVPYADVVDALAGYGIAVQADDVPVELQDRFGQLLSATRDAVLPVFEDREALNFEREEIRGFKQRLAEKPESILLSLAVAKPDVFQKVAELAVQMQADPDVKQRVLHELEVEAREARLNAREARMNAGQLEEKGRRATALTRAAAAKHGVPFEVADRYVAAHVQAEGPEAFDLTSIESLVKEFKPAMPKPQVPRMVTPVQAQKVQQTPPATAGGAPPVPGASSGLNPDANQPGRGGFIRGLMKEAAARVRAAGGET